jgi:uncharacterized SAM-binding protein YcdF (DUF218 family)
MTSRGQHNPERGGAFFKLLVLLFIALLCAVLYFARHPLLSFAAESWMVEDALTHADALIVLGDDNFYGDRATHATQLFRQGLAPLVVASGRKLRPRAGIAELIEHDLLERGVAKEKILRFEYDSESTRGEAEGLAKFAADRKWKSVIVVTSNYQARRVRYIYQHVFAPHIAVSVSSAHDGEFDPQHWYEKSQSIKQLTREFLGLLVAIWDMRGKETPPQAPQSVVGLFVGKLLLRV